VRIGVISDTHMIGCDEGLQRVVDEYFEHCHLILHAGDLVDMSVLDMFGGKEVLAVRGNMDLPSVRRALPEFRMLSIGAFTVALAHGWGPPAGLEDELAKVCGAADCLVYGHTHVPANHVRDGVLFFNPGSPRDGRGGPSRSLGVLHISHEITGEIIVL
jgi:putative phosphoesterase